MTERISALVFDVDDTLYDLAWPFEMAVRKRFGSRYDAILENVCIRSRVHSDAIFDKWTSGAISTDEMYIYRNTASFKDFGVNISRADAIALQEDYLHFQKRIYLTDTVKDMLTALKSRGIPLGIITNGSLAHQGGKLRTLGLSEWIPEEHTLVSGAAGCAKPAPEIFHLMEQRLGIPAEQCWYIGDTYANDVAGAKHAGWHAVWFNRRHGSIPDGDVLPDAVVTSEREMADLITSEGFQRSAHA